MQSSTSMRHMLVRHGTTAGVISGHKIAGRPAIASHFFIHALNSGHFENDLMGGRPAWTCETTKLISNDDRESVTTPLSSRWRTAARRYRGARAHTHGASVRRAARGAPDRRPRPHRLAKRPLRTSRRCRVGRGGADATASATIEAATTGRPLARTRAALTGDAHWRGRGPPAVGGRVERAPTPAGPHGVGGRGRSQRRASRTWPDCAPLWAVVGAPAVQPPPRRSCATAPAAATRRDAGAATPRPPRGRPRHPYGSGGRASHGGSCTC